MRTQLWSSLVKLAFMVVFLVYTAVDQAQKSSSPELYALIGVPFLMIFCDAVGGYFSRDLLSSSLSLNL